jgi:hypothetical protein
MGYADMATSTKQSKNPTLDNLMTELEVRVNRLRSDLREAERELQAVRTTIELLGRGKVDTEAQADEYLQEFRGMTHVAALVKLAHDNGNNRFRLAEAKKLFVAAGLINSKRNASNILSTDIKRSGIFRRVALGEYEVMPPNEREATIFSLENTPRLKFKYSGG